MEGTRPAAGGGCAVAAARKFSQQTLWPAGEKRAGFPAGGSGRSPATYGVSLY